MHCWPGNETVCGCHSDLSWFVRLFFFLHSPLRLNICIRLYTSGFKTSPLRSREHLHLPNNSVKTALVVGTDSTHSWSLDGVFVSTNYCISATHSITPLVCLESNRSGITQRWLLIKTNFNKFSQPNGMHKPLWQQWKWQCCLNPNPFSGRASIQKGICGNKRIKNKLPG